MDWRAMANYLMSQVVRQFATALSSPFMNAYRSFWTEVYGLTKFSPPWLGCVRSTNKHLGSALGLHFVRRKFKDDALKQAENLIHDLTQAYLKHFKDDVTWMDSKTREAAMKKVLGMVEKVGYSKKIKDKKFLAKEYKDMEVNPLTYFDNIVKDYQAAVLYVLHSLGSVPTRSGFDMDITTQNAQYSPKQNTIEVAAGLFQPPLFHKDYPRAVTYGGIGMAAGHEMTHGFDTSGALFDEKGNARSWWTPSTFKKYLSKTMCFVREYSNFTVLNGVYHLRGRQTLNENIADNGGLRIAYLAYENWIKENGNDFALPGKLSSLTSKQLFFISFSQLWCSKMPKSFTLNRVVSDVHTINKYRVIGTARNMKEFGEAFNCPLGSPMNPKTKCIEI